MKKLTIILLSAIVCFSTAAEAKVTNHSKKSIKHHHKFDGIKITPIKIKKK